MSTQMFLNLPVKNLDKSMEFFSKLGFSFNPQFTDKNAACMIVGKDSFVMLLVEQFFKGFTKKEISDSTKVTEAIIAISCESRSKVDEQMRIVHDAGGKETREPQDHGFMYQRSFDDPDGHSWELFYMDLAAMPKD